MASWAVLQLEALLIAEVNLRCHRAAVADTDSGKDPNRVITLMEMTRMMLGPSAERVASAVYLTMTFTLLLAYTARAGGLVNNGMHLPTFMGPALFTAAMGGTIALGGNAGAARVSSVLTGGMLLAFAAVVGPGALQVDWATGLQHADWGAAGTCLPVMFLGLVYHDLIPVVCQLLGYNRRKVTTSLLVGSTLPLLMFLAWEAVCLGLVPYTEGMATDPVDYLISSQGGFASAAIASFSLAALATSAIGVTLSVSSFFKQQLCEHTTLGSPGACDIAQGRKACEAPRSGNATAPAYTPSTLDCVAVLLTLAPPTVASMGDSNVFLTATHLAGAYGDTLLYGILPPMLAWAARDHVPQGKRLLAGGKPVLLGIVGAGVAVAGLQLSLDLPGLQTDAMATMTQPVFDVASAGITTVSASAAQLASAVSWQPGVMQVPQL